MELKCHTCVENAQTRVIIQTKIHARTYDCQLTFNTHRGCVYVAGPLLFNKLRKGHTNTLSTSPADVSSDATLRNRIEALRYRVAFPFFVGLRADGLPPPALFPSFQPPTATPLVGSPSSLALL